MLHQPPITFEAPLITIANMGRVGEQDHEELGITSPGTLFGTPYIFGLFHLLVVHLALFIAPEMLALPSLYCKRYILMCKSWLDATTLLHIVFV